jgi:hypothetical protein
MRKTIPAVLFAFGLIRIALSGLSSQTAAKPRLRLFPLELRIAGGDTYCVPANINMVRVRLGLTDENLRKEYLESCRILNIQPFVFDRDGDLFRELYKMQLIYLGAFPYPGYREATVRFFASLENELERNPPVLKKFRDLVGSQSHYRTNLWDFVQDDLTKAGKQQNLNKLAAVIASLESYQKRFVSHKYLLREEWSHPAYMFYQLDYYREMRKDAYDAILNELKVKNPRMEGDLQSILGSYEKGASWLLEATRFFLEEKWFYQESSGRYESIRDILASLWEPFLGHLPVFKPLIVRLGEIDASARLAVPYRDYPGLLQPLNPEAVRFLKDTPLSTLCGYFDTIGQARFPDETQQLPPGIVNAPLRSFIGSLKNFEATVEWATHQFDIGSPLTFIIDNLPHEIGHFLHSSGISVWDKEYQNGRIVCVQKSDPYKSEGLAELCQYLVLKPSMKKFPMLYHGNLLKHYILSQDPGNHHTWGFLWMRTALDIMDGDFSHLLFAASKPGLGFDEFMASSDLQTERVKGISPDTSPRSFPRQKKRADTARAYVFPSCILEVEDVAFLIVQHSDYSCFGSKTNRKDYASLEDTPAVRDHFVTEAEPVNTIRNWFPTQDVMDEIKATMLPPSVADRIKKILDFLNPLEEAPSKIIGSIHNVEKEN